MDIRDIKDAKVTHTGLLQHNADGTTDLQKITHAGLVARSPEGTAAKGMNIRGNEDLWVEIQANTFRNWVNEHLKDSDMQVRFFFLISNVKSVETIIFALMMMVCFFFCLVGDTGFRLDH